MPENDAENKPKRRNSSSSKPKGKKKVSIIDRWNKTALHNQILVIVGIIGAFSATIYSASYVTGMIIDGWRYKQEHRPILIHSRPPRFLQPITCTPTRFASGNEEVFIQNVQTLHGTDDIAEDVLPYWSLMKLIPEHSTGNKFWDDPPKPNCDVIPDKNPMSFRVLPGEEKVVQIRQGVMTVPPLKGGNGVLLYDVECVYYADHYGTRHATCDTYRFSVPSNGPFDRNWGTPVFNCDGTPQVGAFSEIVTGRCSK